METQVSTTTNPKWMTILGWVLGVLPALLMIFSAVMKLMQPPGMEEAVGKLGWSMSLMTTIGVVELLCVLIYLFPKTAVLGAVLLTGYLGGATATHVRINDAFIGPVIIGAIFWLGLWLREPRLRRLLPFR